MKIESVWENNGDTFTDVSFENSGLMCTVKKCKSGLTYVMQEEDGRTNIPNGLREEDVVNFVKTA